MLEINTINDFLGLPTELQLEIQKAIRAKERLEDFLRTQNKTVGQSAKPMHQARWEECKHCVPGKPGTCKHCAPWNHPGWIWKDQERDDNDIHPSQINKCIKTLWFSCNGFVDQLEEHIDPRTRMIFDLGHSWHHTVQAYGRWGAWSEPQHYRDEVRIDPNALNPDGTPVLPTAHRYWIRGSADAVIDRYIIKNVPRVGDVAIRLVHEYKTINSGQYEKLTRPKPEHKWQATIYAAVFDIPIVVYLYTNKDNCQLADFPVPFDYSIWQEVTKKIDQVQYYTNAGQMPPWEETSAVKDKKECENCGYRKVCAPPQLTQIRRSA